MMMSWVRRFGAPLREAYSHDDDVSDQMIELLEEADRRMGTDNDPRDA